jgi:hypothetical protein
MHTHAHTHTHKRTPLVVAADNNLPSFPAFTKFWFKNVPFSGFSEVASSCCSFVSLALLILLCCGCVLLGMLNVCRSCACVCVCVCRYVFLYIKTYISTYTHTHIHNRSRHTFACERKYMHARILKICKHIHTYTFTKNRHVPT